MTFKKTSKGITMGVIEQPKPVQESTVEVQQPNKDKLEEKNKK